jgi:hypothetical protein
LQKLLNVAKKDGFKMKDGEINIEDVAGLLYAPGADFVFGKYVMIGTRKELIFQRAIEDGYRAGVQAHTKRFLGSEDGEIVALTDKELTALIDQLVPQHLTPTDTDIWRAHFIIGWTCVGLCLVPLDNGSL